MNSPGFGRRFSAENSGLLREFLQVRPGIDAECCL